MQSLYDYLDYRAFLRDRFASLKAKNPHFSFRSFNRQAGVKSSGFLKLVMDGKRNLAADGIRMVARGFKLSEWEKNYFDNLVRYNQANDGAEKDLYFLKLTQSRRFKKAKPLRADQFELYSHWYSVAVLELLHLEPPGSKSAEWLQQRLRPEIPLPDLEATLEKLAKLGLVKKDKRGAWRPTEEILSTQEQVDSLLVARFHQEMSQLAARVIVEENALRREFSSLTIATTSRGFEMAKREIRKLNKKLHSMLEQESSGNKTVVAHFNLQLFPLNKCE